MYFRLYSAVTIEIVIGRFHAQSKRSAASV
jgi:hypothetical protein